MTTATVSPETVIAAARDCIGTPFRHQGRAAGHGLDCIGVVLHALLAAGWEPRSPETTFAADYGRVPLDDTLAKFMAKEGHRVPLQEAQPGDILLMQWPIQDRHPRHVAIVSGTDPLRCIHTEWTLGKVCEHDIDGGWRSRIVDCYRVFGL